jgi:peptide subunit release factor 1 (eRF1)
VLISGADDNVALFRSLLPKSWQSLVVGSFHIGMTASKDEVLQRAMEIGKQAEISQKDRLVEALITNAAKKRGGVIGLEETLKAVHEGRVQTLVLKEGFRAPGYQCSGCSFLTAHPSENCPYCGGIFHNIPDAVELAVRTIMQQGSEVEVLHSEQTAEKVGKIGAILRY